VINFVKRLIPYRLKYWIRTQIWVAQWLEYEINLRIRKRTPIIIFQVSKVGSSSIHRSLQLAGFSPFHHHTLSPEAIRQGMQIIDPNDRRYHLRLRTGLWLYHHVIESGRPVKIITMTRDPIATMVSAYFQTLDRHTGIRNAHEQFTMEELRQRFSDQYVDNTIWHDWYDREFKLATGIDIYAYPFDPVVGYGRIQERHYDVLLLRLETPDEVKEKAIAEFLDLPAFKLDRTNVAQDKSYADAYREFKQKVKIPKKILDLNYESKHTRYFYTPEEITRFRARWER
jgi:hypothetical protein